MSKTNYERNRLLDLRYGDGAYSKPATVYLGLFIAAPTVSAPGTEVSGGSYARAAIPNDAANFPDAVAGAKANGVAVTFAQATALWGSVTHFGLFDAQTGGNLLDFAPVTNPRPVQAADTPSGAIGQLQLLET